jgi:hypothetical protein
MTGKSRRAPCGPPNANGVHRRGAGLGGAGDPPGTCSRIRCPVRKRLSIGQNPTRCSRSAPPEPGRARRSGRRAGRWRRSRWRDVGDDGPDPGLRRGGREPKLEAGRPAVVKLDATLECQLKCQSCQHAMDVCGRQRTERHTVSNGQSSAQPRAFRSTKRRMWDSNPRTRLHPVSGFQDSHGRPRTHSDSSGRSWTWAK